MATVTSSGQILNILIILRAQIFSHKSRIRLLCAPCPLDRVQLMNKLGLESSELLYRVNKAYFVSEENTLPLLPFQGVAILPHCKFNQPNSAHDIWICSHVSFSTNVGLNIKSLILVCVNLPHNLPKSNHEPVSQGSYKANFQLHTILIGR